MYLFLSLAACIDDIRLDGYWLPMSYDEETQSPAATIETMINTRLGCVRTDCWHQCIYPFVCVPFWEDYMCTYVYTHVAPESVQDGPRVISYLIKFQVG